MPEMISKNHENKTSSNELQILLRNLSIDDNTTNNSIKKFQTLTEEKQKNCIDNINLLSKLNGHSGMAVRNTIKHSKSAEATYLSGLYQWSKNITDDIFDDQITNEPPQILLEASNEYDLFERLQFIDKNPNADKTDYSNELLKKTAQTLSIDKKDPKWIDLIDKVFTSDKKQAEQIISDLLKNVGAIPQELYTKKNFKKIGGEKLASVIKILKKFNSNEFPQEKHERVKLLNYLFISKNVKTIRKKGQQNIKLDAKGVLVDLIGLQSHIPFGLVTDECLKSMLEENFITEDIYNEISQRKIDENGELSKKEKNSYTQLKHFTNELNLDENSDRENIKQIIELIINNPEKFARDVQKKSLIIPDIIIKEICYSNNNDAVFALLRTAEIIGINISQEELRQKPQLLSTHELMNSTKESYSARQEILSNPEYYNATKITKHFLNSGITSDPDNEFLVFKAQYKKTRLGHQHSFVEILNKGKIARVLINEEKHIGKDLNNLDHLEKFELDEYKTLENALRTFDYFSTTVERMQKIISNQNKNWQKNLITLSETGLHFLLTNVTKYYQEANELYAKIRFNENHTAQDYEDLINIFITASKDYSNFLYHNAKNTKNFQEKFSPEITKLDVNFDEGFLKGLKEKAAPDGYTEEFFSSDHKIRTVLLNYKTDDPTKSIPYHIEESCLDALRIQRDKPLINIIGGCRQSDTNGVEGDPLDHFSSSVMNISDKYQANVGVPGTDSGIGTAFGRKNIEYTNKTEHIPHRDKAHLFAINPGGNTYVPNNKFTENTVRNEIFANAPVDSIITPFTAGWELQGKDKYKSPYLNHIAYMEALYQRIGFGQSKTMVVGNGGLYSIMEINESIQRDSNLLLVKDSGRFAEITSLIIENIDKFNLNGDQNIESEKIIKFIQDNLEDEVANEFLKKDFGFESDPENEDYEVYRTFFYKFLQLAKIHIERIKITNLKDLEADLDNIIKK